MSTLEELMKVARETNESFLNADAEVEEAEDTLRAARDRWDEANSARERAEAAVLNYIRASVNGKENAP